LKTLIACYSFTGNSLAVAEELQKNINADITRIEPVNDRWYVIKAVHAYLEKKWPIKPCTTDLSDYDFLVVCSPVWASRTPPAVNQYLAELENVAGKKFAALVTMGGNGSQIATTQITMALESQGMEFVDELQLTGNELKSGEWSVQVEEFAKNFL
jgi:flavodoxin